MADSERICRGTVSASRGADAMREAQVQLAGNETRDHLEHFEPYGFSSEPIADGGTDAAVVFFDDSRAHGAVLCIADRRYRITSMKSGEVAIFDDKQRHVYLKRDGIEIDGVSDPITIKTSGEVTIKAAKITLDAPVVETTGNLNVAGATSGGGDVTAGSISLQGHTHGGVETGGSNTSTPN